MTWQDYFDACADNDIWKAFETLAGVGVLPIVVGEDRKGKHKLAMEIANHVEIVECDRESGLWVIRRRFREIEYRTKTVQQAMFA